MLYGDLFLNIHIVQPNILTPFITVHGVGDCDSFLTMPSFLFRMVPYVICQMSVIDILLSA